MKTKEENMIKLESLLETADTAGAPTFRGTGNWGLGGYRQLVKNDPDPDLGPNPVAGGFLGDGGLPIYDDEEPTYMRDSHDRIVVAEETSAGVGDVNRQAYTDLPGSGRMAQLVAPQAHAPVDNSEEPEWIGPYEKPSSSKTGLVSEIEELLECWQEKYDDLMFAYKLQDLKPMTEKDLEYGFGTIEEPVDFVAELPKKPVKELEKLKEAFKSQAQRAYFWTMANKEGGKWKEMAHEFEKETKKKKLPAKKTKTKK